VLAAPLALHPVYDPMVFAQPKLAFPGLLPLCGFRSRVYASGALSPKAFALFEPPTFSLLPLAWSHLGFALPKIYSTSFLLLFLHMVWPPEIVHVWAVSYPTTFTCRFHLLSPLHSLGIQTLLFALAEISPSQACNPWDCPSVGLAAHKARPLIAFSPPWDSPELSPKLLVNQACHPSALLNRLAHKGLVSFACSPGGLLTGWSWSNPAMSMRFYFLSSAFVSVLSFYCYHAAICLWSYS
jgi:hypothetical protein